MIRRLYDPKNIPRLIEYGKIWHRMSVMKDLPFDSKRCDSLLRTAFMAPDMAVWASFDGKVVHGVLIGAVCEYPCFDAKYVTDIIFIADREGDKLYRSLEQWGRSHGAHCIQMGVSSGLAGAGEFYQAKGLQQVGGIFWRSFK